MTRAPRTVDLDRVIASAPVNADAAHAVGRGGEPPVLAKRGTIDNHYALEPTKPLCRQNPDLRGVRFGRFTVVGYLGKRNRKQPALRLVRCACGVFEHRRAAAIKNPENLGDRCIECWELVYLKKEDFHRRTGRWPTDEELEP